MSAAVSIPEFYAGRSIFITGATGFMGKVLLEKLLRSCPDIHKIYLLIRPKKGKEVQDRLEDLLDAKLFDTLRAQQPDHRDKCCCVKGDITEDGLGLDQSDEDMLTQEVSIVFHSAATVKFDEAMKLSIEMNVQGVYSVINLCKKMTKLTAFVHISTAYSNCDRPIVTEEVFPPPLSPQKLLDACEWMDIETMNKLTPKMISKRPNTYTYTKAIAESLLQDKGADLPLAIFRPSIIGATYQEPVKGWIDNLNGPTGLIVLLGKGVLHVMKGDVDATADVIPADLVSNMLIAIGWHTATVGREQLKVYHCTTGELNRVNWGYLINTSLENVMKHPLESVLKVPSALLTKSELRHDISRFYKQLLPAYVMDLYMWISGRRRMFVKIQERVHKAVSVLDFFTSNSWSFTSDNLLMLEGHMSAEDLKLFPFNPKCIHWPTYMENYTLGAKQFVLKEKLVDLPAARKALARLQRLTLLFKTLLFTAMGTLLVKRFAAARAIWNLVLRWAVGAFRIIPGFARSG